MTTSEWMNEFFTTTSSPKGHGFNQSDVAAGFACYSFEPRSDIPIRVIVLDDTQNTTELIDPGSLGYGHGTLDKKRYDWLVNELDRGQADGKLMIIAAHVPIGVLEYPEMAGWSKYAYVSQDQLIAKLHTYPNFMLWISGHLHINQVSAFKSPDPVNHPEYGFWEVQTSSLRDYPQQYRTFDIERNSDNTVSIFITDVDPSVSDGSLAEKSRSYGVAGQEIFVNPLNPSPNGSYNAELVKKLSPEMTEKIGNLFRTPDVPDNFGDDSNSPIINPAEITTQTVNAGGGSAVTRVEMTGTNLGKNLVVTAMPRSVLPETMAAPPTTVYQYISITSSTIPGVVSQTLIDFTVPQSWLTEHGFATGDIVMMHNVDGQWQTLNTRFVSQSNGNVFYQATTPGFSYFAIAYQKGGTTLMQGTPIPTTITTTTPSALAKTTVTYTPRVPVAIAKKETQAPAPAPATAPVEGMPLTLIIIGIAGAIAVIAGAFVVRRWWIRRQNPALFEDTPFFR